ncbi:phenylacetate-CoA oxygenase subunit PaaJ [Corynebacterium sp. NML 120412]|uniref:1,2-phenylacetyl-CoA epoxidase subunit PaaD n=1 Tax=Corynebacterium sp. NML 120412 TaxID=2029401 RepID=UPI000BAA39DC|nr:1,2-phenylacetyl-CoA epoxidase subunit PaaD [Corynebacterium sp. NML 120412]PAT14873.1 phenylacetate-CoA oxygenase subunit PaaJ [Corynebacterium sp. NML 120412]
MATTEQAHRPTDESEARLWDVAAQVPDPEIPVISIADLGILRDAHFEGDTAVITITPTYSGCPAMGHITNDVELALAKAGYRDFRVDLVLNPAWTTDWITETGRENLRSFGIAPPQGRAEQSSGPVLLRLGTPPRITCPQCGSDDTKEITPFGSTSCKALYSCNTCFEPFDYFKVH